MTNMKTTRIAEAWWNDLHEVLAGEPLTIKEIRLGVFYTAAQVSSGHVGVAFTPRDLSDTVCCPRSAASAPPAGTIAGQNAWDVARYALTDAPLRRAVGIAVLNALSSLAMERHGIPGGRLLPGVDALQAAEVLPEDRVVLVGAFVPFIKALKDKVADLRVVDKHPQALRPEEQGLWQSPLQAMEALAQATVVVITGSALVEGGLESLLDAAKEARRIVLAGPTASPWPPTFFARGIHVLGGIRVLDGDKMLQVVSEGGSGYFFEDYGEKVCLVSAIN